MHRRIRIVLALALLAGVGGCGGDEISPAELELSATLEQWRADEVARVVQLAVGNRSGAAVQVDRLQLVTPGFEPVPVAVVDHRVPVGPRVDLPVRYGAARCGPLPGGRTEVVARIRTDEHDEPRTVRFRFPDREPLLERLRVAECDQRALAEVVQVELADLERTGDLLRGQVRLQRRVEGARVTLVAVGGTVIFGLRAVPPRGPPLVRLEPGTDEVAGDVEITADRCDPHALIESKKTYVFPMHLQLGDGEPRYIPVEPRGRTRELLAMLIQDVCRLP
jgi:hypothetical protein